jgi:hypothetical protein
MQNFGMFFRLGVEHIADLTGYDHILFITSLCLTYVLKDWKKVLILITAFTIGHSVTLALSVYNKIIIPTAWIEFLIPVTILITSVMNLFPDKQQKNSHRPELLYVLTLFFGLIHGMGFSNYLKSLMGKTENIVTELFAFNVGLEAGQLMIVASVLLVSFIFVVGLNIKRQWWVTAISSIAILMALKMCIDRFPL